MSDDFEIRDFDGILITVGDRVRVWDYDEKHPEWGQHDKYRGEVISLGEWDGDADDNTGRSIAIEPDITVRFDNGEKESFRTSEWEFAWQGEMVAVKGKVEELKAL